MLICIHTAYNFIRFEVKNEAEILNKTNSISNIIRIDLFEISERDKHGNALCGNFIKRLI